MKQNICGFDCHCTLNAEAKEQFMKKAREVMTKAAVLSLIGEMNSATGEGGCCLQVLKAIPRELLK